MKKKIIWYLTMLLAITFSAKAQTPVWNGSIASQYGGGIGTQANPYLISLPDELACLAQKVNDGTDYAGVNFKMMSNIDLNHLDWTPIGQAGSAKPFKGNFDGNNKKIMNLNVAASDYAGFFGWVHTTGKIENLEILNGLVSIILSDQEKNIYAGGIAACSQGTIINCRNGAKIRAVSGSATGVLTICAGGIVGESYGSVKNCFNKDRISAEAHPSNWSAMTNAGGIAGRSYGSVQNAYNRGDVLSNPFYAGGIVGHNAGSEIQNAYNTGVLTSTWSQIGAITANGIATNSFYLEGCASAAGGGIVKSSDEMKSTGFPGVLNANQIPAIWISDFVPNINDGYPILYFEQAEQAQGALVNIHNNEHGKIRVLKDGVELNSGDRVQPGTKLRLIAVPDDNYVLKRFTADGADIFGYDFEVYTDVDLSGVFEYVEGVIRWDGTTAEKFAYGKGTRKDPYQIHTAQELALLGQRTQELAYDGNVYFKLMNPIDLQMIDWTPIGGDAEHPFRANFDGNHRVIANLYIKSKERSCVGLFGYVNPVEIKNLGITGNSIVQTTKDYSNAGMLAGLNFGNILNCYADGIVKVAFGSYGGGLVARNGGNILNAYFKGSVEASDYALGAGICAENTKLVQNCYNTGDVNALTNTSHVGAVVFDNTGSLSNCYYLDTSCTEAGGGISKTKADMQTSSFVTVLNAQSPDRPWMTDIAPGRNQGYPILKWESGSIFPIRILQVSEGTLKVYDGERELQYSDQVNWGTCLRFSATPKGDYIIENFIYDDQAIFGEEQLVHDTAQVSSSFVLKEGILRWNGTISSSFGGGNGSKENPYLINTPEELAYLASQVNNGVIYENKYFKLIHSLDLCHKPWTPIGINLVNSMTGSFDGGGHIIANLRSTAVNAGLFGVIAEVSKEIKNIGLEGVNILRNPDTVSQGDSPTSGLIAGKNHSFIEKCYTKGGDIHSLQGSGGITGSNLGTIRNVYSYNSINSDLYAGGITGSNWGSIAHVYSISEINSSFQSQNYKGGIAGASIGNKAKIEEAYYLKDKGTNVGGGLPKTASEIKSLAFVNLLNQAQESPAWSSDLEPSLNQGFPILKWQDPRKFVIAVSQSQNGIIEPGTTEVSFGENLRMNILPDADCYIQDVLVDDESIGGTDSYTFVNITRNHSITAIFALKQYVIEVIQAPGGSISPQAAKVESGKSITFDITPDLNYEVSVLIVDGIHIPAANSYSFTNVTTDHSISSVFGLKTSMEPSDKVNSDNVFVFGKEIYIDSSTNEIKQAELLDMSGRKLSNYSYQSHCVIYVEQKGAYILYINKPNQTICKKLIIR